jgi:hypothetical protein
VRTRSGQPVAQYIPGTRSVTSIGPVELAGLSDPAQSAERLPNVKNVRIERSTERMTTSLT